MLLDHCAVISHCKTPNIFFPRDVEGCPWLFRVNVNNLNDSDCEDTEAKVDLKSRRPIPLCRSRNSEIAKIRKKLPKPDTIFSEKSIPWPRVSKNGKIRFFHSYPKE